VSEQLSQSEVRRLIAGEHVPKRKAPVQAGVYAFTIPGLPIGKPRMTRRDKWFKRPSVQRYWAWAAAARLAAGTLPDPSQIISLDWKAYFPPPQSWSKKRRLEAIGRPHRSSPDRDNIDKAILDALFKDDRGIPGGWIEKLWGEPARIEVRIKLQ